MNGFSLTFIVYSHDEFIDSNEFWKGYGWICVDHCSSFQLSLSSLNRTSLFAYDNFYHENFILISLKKRDFAWSEFSM